MNPDHTHYAEWDAAYALGALSAADRAEFEEHLAGCEDCRRAVAELTPAVGLLSRLSAEDARRVADEEGPARSLRSGIVRLDAERRARRRRRWWVVAAASVVVLLAAVVTPIAVGVGAPDRVAMSNLEDVPLEASVALTPVGWGTRIDLDCEYEDGYAPADMPDGGWTYTLAVVGAEGDAEAVSSWRAGPGSTARLSAGTALSIDDIDAVEVRSTAGDVLLIYSPGD